MLVKIVAMGHSQTIWKNVFHHLRMLVPNVPFSAGIFASAEEMEYLAGEYFTLHWRREAPDFLLSDASPPAQWPQRLAFLERVQRLDTEVPAVLALALTTIEHGLKQLVQGGVPTRLHLSQRVNLSLSDASLIVRAFPADFPRVRVTDHVSALRLHRRKGAAVELRPLDLDNGSLVGFAQVEAVLQDGAALPPAEWLKRVLKAERVKLPAAMVAGLIREARGVYLFPGVPVDRVRAVTLGAVTFSHLIDLGLMSEASPHFHLIGQAVRKAAQRQRRIWNGLTERLRQAEAKRDFPVICAGPVPLLNATMAALLERQGFRRCVALEALGEGAVREPTLLLRLAPGDGAEAPVQVEPPRVLDVHGEVAPQLARLEGLLGWEAVPYAPPAADAAALTPQAFEEQRGRLVTRLAKVRRGLGLARNRGLLLRQERDVQSRALAKLEELLEARDALQVWSGALPRSATQVLVFSHDQEEAGAVLQAAPGIGKKRWFDLSPFTSAETVQNLTLEPVRHYLDGGVMVVTAASREKLLALRERIAKAQAEGQAALADADAALAAYQEEHGKASGLAAELARRWVWHALAAWLSGHLAEVLAALAEVRRRHERSWFHPARVHRTVVIASNAENRQALAEACEQVYPALNASQSTVVPYDFEPDEPPADRAPAAPQPRRRRTEALFADYLQVLDNALSAVHADLLLIEQRREYGPRILEHLRAAVPQFRDLPAVLVFPDYWAPAPTEALPWERTRVVLLRRLGALAAPECADHLRHLYAD